MSEKTWGAAQYVLSVLFVLACCTLFMLATASCWTVREAQRLEQMSDDEVDAFAQRVSIQVGVVAQALVAEGDLDPSDLATIAAALEGLAAGTTAPTAGGLAGAIGVEGYGAAALTLAVIELDAELSRRGALEPGGAMSPRACLVLSAVAARLSQVASQE